MVRRSRVPIALFFLKIDWWSFRNEYQGVLFLMRMSYDKCGLSAMRCSYPGAVISIKDMKYEESN